MVGRVLALMNREIRGLHEAAYLLAFFAFLSQALALIRDRTFAHLFGAGETLDAYFAAFKVPDLMFAFLTLFVSSFALIPLIATRGGVSERESQSLVGSVLVVFGGVAVLASALLFFLIPSIVPIVFPGFSADTQVTVVQLSQILLLQPIFLGVSSVIASVIQASRKFFIYALAPIFYNVGIIVGAVFFYPLYGVYGLGWGVVLGAALHLLVQVVPLVLYKTGFQLSISSAPIRDALLVARASLPRTLALTSNQILMLVLISVASLAAAGSVASVSFAFNLQSVPLSVVGVSYAAALFPSLALLFAKNDLKTYASEVWAAIRHIIFWTVPAIALMVVLRAHAVRVVLGSGEFSWNDTRLTAAILAAFVISLVAQAAILVFSRAYYAARRDVTPILMNVGIAIVAGLVAYLSFQWFVTTPAVMYFIEDLFRIDSIPGSSVVMVALGYSVAMLCGGLLFGVLFARDFGFEKAVAGTLLHSFSSAVIAAAAAYGTLQLFGPLLPTETFVGIFTQGVAAGVVGLIVWAATLYVLKSQEFAEVVTVGAKLLKKRT